MRQERPDGLPGNFLPVYPLILGGDDVFILLPAPWALDFARRFAQAYEREMKQVVEETGLEDIPNPTISVAVVICKSKHPYALAHEAGERRLKQAKQMGKRLALKTGKHPTSTVNFEVVLGGRLVEELEPNGCCPTLRPYWAADVQPVKSWGIPIKNLIEHRYALRSIPRRRLSMLKDLYDVKNMPSKKKEQMERWQAQLAHLLGRIGRNEMHREAVETALRALGEGHLPYWYRVSRHPEDPWYGHGLPDLLEAWDFALDVSRSPSEYYEEG